MEFEKIKSILIEIFNINPKDADSKIRPEARFVEDLNADSLDVYQMICELQNQFGIELTDKECEGIKTVQDAVDLLQSKLK